jgi:hypothetical protein
MKIELIEHPWLAHGAHRPVQSIEAVCIYYCFRGRNAYWGTWATHYFPGCMHHSLASAQAFAEGQRTQGSVFYVHQLPALLLSTGISCALVTQINTGHPLKDYSHKALPEKEGWVHRTAKNTKSVILAKGEVLSDVLSSFSPDSNFWRVPPPTKNSVVMLAVEGAVNDLERLDSHKLHSWVSKSLGPDYLLNWRQEGQITEASAVSSLRHEAQSNNDLQGDAPQASRA